MVLHLPLRDLDNIFQGCRTNTPCLSVAHRSPPSASQCLCTIKLAGRPLDLYPVLVFFLVDEEYWKIYVEFFIFPRQSCGFNDDLVGGGVDVSCAVFGGLVNVMVSGVLISSVCSAGGEISFSDAVSSRHAVGVNLVVGGGHLAAVGWRGHSPAEGVGCLLLSALLL